MFSHTYETRYGDYKDFEQIKPAVLLDMVQDVSVRHSAELGYGLLPLRNMKRAWLLDGIKAHFDAPIKILEDVTLCTAVKSMRGLISERGCIAYQNGLPVAKTVALWFMFDSENMKPCRIPEDMKNVYPIHDFNDDFFSYKKLQTEDAPIVGEYLVANRDIDTNGHLNNQKGAELLMEALPSDFNLTDMSIVYKSSAYKAQKLMMCKKEIENGYYIHLQRENGEVCLAGKFLSNCQ